MQHIRTAASKLNGCKLKYNAPLAATLDALGRTLQLGSREETVALVAILDRQCAGNNSGLDDLSNYFNCSALDVMSLVPALNTLTQRGFITVENRSERLLTRKEFKLCPDVFYAIIEGRKVQPVPPAGDDRLDRFEFCQAVHKLIEERDNGNIETAKLFIQAAALEDEYADMPLVRELRGRIADIADRTLFYEMCVDFTNDSDGGHSDLGSTLGDIYDRILSRVRQKLLITRDEHPLQQAGLAELRNEDELHLTDEGIRLLLGEAAQAFIRNAGGLDRYAFLVEVDKLVDDLPRQPMPVQLRRAFRQIQKLEKANPQLEELAKLAALLPDVHDRTLFYLILKELLDGDTYYVRQLHYLYAKQDELQVQRSLKDGRHPLQQSGLVEMTKGGLFEDSSLVPTEKGKELYLGEDADLFADSVEDSALILPEKIACKPLFFDPALQQQLSLLTGSLEEERYAGLRARLQAQHLPTGVTALLYGHPGTGKTESVMQLARATGRAVMHVDISATKTCWFGESEKLIKQVFDRYRRLCQKSRTMPILLFNEADAVFSRRKDVGSSSVAQTENAIQNIILEEMETLDGILIATTNLADNLDRAFERRFLFKIRFDKPTVESKTRIWRSKLPALAEADARALALQYDFSGGEIDNIVRKATMEEVISGNAPTPDTLARLCEHEKLEHASASARRIGFRP